MNWISINYQTINFSNSELHDCLFGCCCWFFFRHLVFPFIVNLSESTIYCLTVFSVHTHTHVRRTSSWLYLFCETCFMTSIRPECKHLQYTPYSLACQPKPNMRILKRRDDTVKCQKKERDRMNEWTKKNIYIRARPLVIVKVIASIEHVLIITNRVCIY